MTDDEFGEELRMIAITSATHGFQCGYRSACDLLMLVAGEAGDPSLSLALTQLAMKLMSESDTMTDGFRKVAGEIVANKPN